MLLFFLSLSPIYPFIFGFSFFLVRDQRYTLHVREARQHDTSSLKSKLAIGICPRMKMMLYSRPKTIGKLQVTTTSREENLPRRPRYTEVRWPSPAINDSSLSAQAPSLFLGSWHVHLMIPRCQGFENDPSFTETNNERYVRIDKLNH